MTRLDSLKIIQASKRNILNLFKLITGDVED